jgi:hypothetical protein
MAGRPPRGLADGQERAQIAITIARGSTQTSAAHTAVNTAQYSHTWHAARHDVNDPPYERWGHPRFAAPGSLTSWRAVSFPNSICFDGRHRAPPVGGVERANQLRALRVTCESLRLPWCSRCSANYRLCVQMRTTHGVSGLSDRRDSVELFTRRR